VTNRQHVARDRSRAGYQSVTAYHKRRPVATAFRQNRAESAPNPRHFRPESRQRASESIEQSEMEEQRRILLKSLPRFLQHRLTDGRLTLADVPPGLQEVTFRYAEQRGRLDDLSRPGYCEEFVCRAMDELCQQCLEEIARNTGGFKTASRDFVAVLCVRARYLAAPLDGRKVETLGDALDCLENPDYLEAFWPEGLLPQVRAEAEDAIPRLRSLGTRKPTGTAGQRLKQGLEILADAIWAAYQVLISTILTNSEPGVGESPPPSPDDWRKQFAQRIRHRREATCVPDPSLSPEHQPSVPHPEPEGATSGEKPSVSLPEDLPDVEGSLALKPELVETPTPEEPLRQEELLVQERDHDAETTSYLRRQFPFPETGYSVPRADLLDRVKELLLANEGPTVIGLWGTAGVGKTALLQMLWHDAKVQDHFEFPLWADLELGADESLDAGRARERRQEQLALWAKALSVPTAGPTGVESLTQAIREQLQGRRVLLLLDDAWSGASIQPFLVGGKTVFTTRNRALLEGLHLDYEMVNVPPMDLAEVQALVKQGTGQELEPDDPRLKALYEGTGALPQALGAVVSRLGELGWDRLLRFLSDEQSRLAFLEQGEGRSRSHSLRASFALSYERLRPEQQHLFRTLGALAPAPVSADVVHAVWQQRTVDVTELELRRLADLSLVQAYPVVEGTTLFYLTGLWRDYARERLLESGGLETFEERYVDDQVERIHDLRQRFHAFGDDTTQVMPEFSEALAHIDYAYRLANLQRDVAHLHQVLVDCPLLLIYGGWIDVWREWLDLLQPWLGQAPPDSEAHRALLVEWQLQRTDLLLEQGQVREAVNILNGIRRLCRHDPGQEANRQLALASTALQSGQTRKAGRYLEGARKLRAVRRSPPLRSRLHSLEARLAREGRIPLHIVDAHGQAILACRLEGNQASELAERLNLAESLRQFGWVEKAAAQLEHVAVQAGQLELGYLYALSLVRLVHLHLDRGDVGKADEAMDCLRPLGATEELAPLEARLRDTPRLRRNVRFERWPELAQRIVVVGPPGSGKTVLARRLAQQLDWPHMGLDRLYWPSGWRPVPAGTFREHTLQALSGETWVVDGDHWQVRDIVWGRADLVLWLNYSPWQVLRQIARREKVDHDDQPDNSALWLRAARALGAGRKEYPLALSLMGLEQLTPRIVHLVSPERAERWLSEFVQAKQHRAAVE
jgi:tRNA A37 threonylcarbamoyladenosine biosynthesis protein TsaE